MGKESHRWYWKTTWPSVKLGKVPDRERKACLNFGVTFCITNPIYFGALGQCLHVNVISSRQLDFVTNSQKPFCNPIWGPLVLDLNEKVKPPSSPASYPGGHFVFETASHLPDKPWGSTSSSKFLSASNCLLGLIYTSIKVHVKKENSIKNMICACFSFGIHGICVRGRGLWDELWFVKPHPQNSWQWEQLKCS
jgi:hypothetical protein